MGIKEDGRTFTRDEIDQVKRENPIEEVVARYVTLRRRGRSLVGLCPFHQETDPSFTVTPAMERWHCFGACGEGGDVIDFVMRITGDSFTEAMERLGSNRLPPPVPVPTSWRGLCRIPARGGHRGSRELTHDDRRLIKAAAVLYHTAFFLNPQAVRYVIGRGISIPTAQRQMVGYARGDRLVPYLKYKGFRVSRALDLGLLRRVPPQAGLRQRGTPRDGRLEEFFWDRVVLAETDRRGDVVHLIGRALDPEVKPKYLSAPGMPKPVYGMARLDPSRPAELVEGPFDYLTLLEWGYQGLATLGTHLNDRDARRLSEMPEVIITPDADDAGWSAARDWALAIGPDRVRFRVLPEGVKDLNDLAQLQNGRLAFPRLPLLTLDEATGMADFDPGWPVIVVRSRFDRLILQEWGYQAVCVLGRTITPEMADELVAAARNSVLGGAPSMLVVPDAPHTGLGWQACRDWLAVTGDLAEVVSLPDGIATVRELARSAAGDGQAVFYRLVAALLSQYRPGQAHRCAMKR